MILSAFDVLDNQLKGMTASYDAICLIDTKWNLSKLLSNTGKIWDLSS